MCRGASVHVVASVSVCWVVGAVLWQDLKGRAWTQQQWG
jgi:hypothetical protein